MHNFFCKKKLISYFFQVTMFLFIRHKPWHKLCRDSPCNKSMVLIHWQHKSSQIIDFLNSTSSPIKHFNDFFEKFGPFRKLRISIPDGSLMTTFLFATHRETLYDPIYLKMKYVCTHGDVTLINDQDKWGYTWVLFFLPLSPNQGSSKQKLLLISQSYVEILTFRWNKMLYGCH